MSPLSDSCYAASRAAGLIGIAVGLSVLLGGWMLDIALLRVVVPGYPAMMPNVACGLMLCGLALWLGGGGHASRSARARLGQACAAAAGLLGLTVFQTSMLSSANFLLLGGALLLSGTRRRFAAAQYFALTACFLSLFASIGHLDGNAGLSALAIHTSLTFIVLGAGVLLARPHWGLLATINSPAPGGAMTRRLLPAALLIPIVMGWLRIEGQTHGLYDAEFGRAFFTPLVISLFAFVIWKSGQQINQLDSERARAEWKARQLANSMPLMVWTAQADGRSDYFNQRSAEYLGLEFEGMRDGGWVAAIHPAEVADVMSRRARAFANAEPYTMEYRFRRACDGMYRWHLAQGVPVFNPEGGVSRWIGTCTDIHSIKTAEEALRNSEAQFRQLADSMPQMVWTAKPDGNIDYYNQYWHDYTGLDVEQSKNWGWQPALHPEDLAQTIARWTTAFRTGGPYETEFRLKRADGVYHWHLGRARAIRNAQGAVERWFGTCTDIEAYKQAEAEIRLLNDKLEERVRARTLELEQANQRLASVNEELSQSTLRLEQSNRELQDFASVASHDLQEPLRKVQAFGDRLKSVAQGAMDEQARDYLERMLNASKRMKSLIDDLLRFARVTSQAQPFLPVDLNRVTQEVLADLEVRIAETGARVEVGDLAMVDADEFQMRQLLQNLLGNALKFHRPDQPPAVRVYAETAAAEPAADGLFRFVVADEGIGFDEKYLDRIFTVFQRLHGRAEYEGTGVGLAICRKIVQRHGGEITARSAPGEGASFVVALPVHHARGALEREDVAPAGRGQTASATSA